MGLRNRKSINKAVLLWVAAALLLLIMAAPALSVIFAAPGSVNSKAIVNGAVKARKIAGGAVNSAKIADGGIAGVDIANGAIDSAKLADGSITNADIAAGAAIAASKINRTGFDADLLDGFDASEFIRNTGAQSFTGGLTADSFNYTTTKTGYVTLPPAAFVQYGPSKVLIYDGEIQPDPSFGGFVAGAVAPVALPDGAVITELKASVLDSTSTGEVQINLRRIPMDGTWGEVLADASTTAADPDWQILMDSTIDSATVDNAAYAYQVSGQMIKLAGSEHKIGVVRIKYTYTTAGP